MTETQEKLQKVNNEVLKLLNYFHENFNEETRVIQRDLESVSKQIIELITKDLKQENNIGL